MKTTDEEGKVITEKNTGYTTDIITDKALAWLKNDREKDKPFMLMYQHKAPHRNWQPGPKHLTMFDGVDIPEPETLWDDYKGRTSAAGKQTMTIARHLNENDLKLNQGPRNLTPEQRKVWEAAYGPKNEAFRKANLQGEALVKWKYQRYIKDYLRCIASVDDNTGRLVDWLQANGLSENTIVIYTSDQGFFLGEHGRTDKRLSYDEALFFPLIVRYPPEIARGPDALPLERRVCTTVLAVCVSITVKLAHRSLAASHHVRKRRRSRMSWHACAASRSGAPPAQEETPRGEASPGVAPPRPATPGEAEPG